MKSNLSNWLTAFCAILLIVLLILQAKQNNQLEMLLGEHQAFVSATEQRQQVTRDAVSKLADQVATVGANLLQDEQQAKKTLAEGITMQQDSSTQRDSLVQP